MLYGTVWRGGEKVIFEDFSAKKRGNGKGLGVARPATLRGTNFWVDQPKYPVLRDTCAPTSVELQKPQPTHPRKVLWHLKGCAWEGGSHFWDGLEGVALSGASREIVAPIKDVGEPLSGQMALQSCALCFFARFLGWILEGEFLEGEFSWGPLLLEKTGSREINPRIRVPKVRRPRIQPQLRVPEVQLHERTAICPWPLSHYTKKLLSDFAMILHSRDGGISGSLRNKQTTEEKKNRKKQKKKEISSRDCPGIFCGFCFTCLFFPIRTDSEQHMSKIWPSTQLPKFVYVYVVFISLSFALQITEIPAKFSDSQGERSQMFPPEAAIFVAFRSPSRQ